MPRTVLAVLNLWETAHPVLEAAALAAERMGGARIDVLHIRHSPMEDFLPSEEVMTSEREQALTEEAGRRSADLREVFDAWARQGGTRADATWREVVGKTAAVLTAEAPGAGLVVAGQAAAEHYEDARAAIYAVLFDAEAPLLLVPDTVPASLGRLAAVAWKEDEAANRAAEAAMLLLVRAERVVILLGDKSGNDAIPADLVEALRKANVPVQLDRFAAGELGIGAALLREAHARGADVLVMGAYTHSRIFELVLGGATRDILAVADMPVLLRH